MKISMVDDNTVILDIFSQSKNIKFTSFVLEMVDFRIAFTDYQINLK